MSFWRRLRFYLIGIGIGSLMVLFFFGDRGCGGWLPSNRVKTSIINAKFTSSDFIDCKLQCNDYTAETITEFIQKAEVNFNSSKKDSDPKEYVLEHNEKTLIFAIPSDPELPVYIIDKFEKECVSCDTLSKEYDKLIKLPFKKK